MKKKYILLLEYPLIRFLLVGGLNTVFGYGLFALLFYLGLGVQISLLVSTICGVLFNFKTIGNLVFRDNNNLLLFKFTLVYTIIYFLNLLGMKILKFYGFNAYLSMLIIIIPMALLGFFLNNRFVFAKNKN